MHFFLILAALITTTLLKQPSTSLIDFAWSHTTLPEPADPETADVEDLLDEVLVLSEKYIDCLACMMARRPFSIDGCAGCRYGWPSDKQLIHVEEDEDEEDEEGETHCLGLEFIIEAAAETVEDALRAVRDALAATEHIAEESEHPLLIAHRHIYD
ncbi:uncharacterized protein K441DRAFT_682915 [Cenococcum geophilum 1.58]|uniref:Uncharacterized protein n=1 Tax=Cenococcum geophilum 1.58 TaxID=794803 RepID=A0ACC8EL32_9PEZI|nr:hypothetical protein K441DRAFT_682915 [Cenococcum geophilum 1.58]